MYLQDNICVSKKVHKKLLVLWILDHNWTKTAELKWFEQTQTMASATCCHDFKNKVINTPSASKRILHLHYVYYECSMSMSTISYIVKYILTNVNNKKRHRERWQQKAHSTVFGYAELSKIEDRWRFFFFYILSQIKWTCKNSTECGDH